ncbi:DoxX family membrane protein [Streptomyces sp. DSM 44917]|uniref:DoxX family membrane protein n=1 Tax=Streptomyces boetiae TaxID=3075541 RepID=A0ABU2L8V6_9ACTN|nr:DoxX family membrane protein [Streptomyces sp. DSM 44917]MDT0308001.1 DoxX family membrane protein [Streptomyces sp. DSM 44917]
MGGVGEGAAGRRGRRLLAVTRVLIGVIFLFGFLDKTFGLTYFTPRGEGWVDGGSPTRGYLGDVAAGPFQDTFNSWAGDAWADWSFMAGLLGVGLAVTFGFALRVAAVGGTVMMALMWAAVWPPDRTLADGAPSMSANPLVEYHVIYAAVLIVVAYFGAGETWGLARAWRRLPVVRGLRWLH